MSVETVLDNNVLKSLREGNIITGDEIAICAGDIYYAKNVLTNEKRIIDATQFIKNNTSEAISENSNRTLLKG